MKTVHTQLPYRAAVDKDTTAHLKVITTALSQDKAGLIKTHTLMDDEANANAQAPQVKAVPTSTAFELQKLQNVLTKAVRVSTEIETANTSSKADIIVGDTTIATDVPVTALMPLKKQLAKLVPTLSGIKTLDKAIVWVEATGQDYPNVYVSNNPVTTDQTVVAKEWKVIAEATPQHPAQLKEVEQRTVVGQYTTTAYSGNMHSTDKEALLTKLNALITAVESAIQRANSSAIIEESTLGDEISNYLFS